MLCFSHKLTRPRHSAGQGFTLLEMAIVVAIIAVILAGGAVTFSASVQQKQFEQTKEKLATLQKALRDYWLTFGRLPCPASLALYNNVDSGATNSNFGKEAATPGTCTGSTPTADYSSGDFVAGMVPTKTLQLPDEMAFDGWGRRIFYAVDINYTGNDEIRNFPEASSDVATGVARIIVRSAAGDNKTTQAVYVLLSHGPNGHGAYPRYNSITRISSGSSNTSERANCDCTSAGVDSGFDNIFVQAPYSTDTSTTVDTFDDLLVFDTRANLASPKE